MTIEDISNTTPTASTTTVALSPVEQLRAKIHDAEKEFAQVLRTEFEALSVRADELNEQINETHFANDQSLQKALTRAIKGLAEVVEILGDSIDTADEDMN